MSDSVVEISDRSSNSSPGLVRKGHPLIAWVVIALVVGFVLARRAASEAASKAEFDRVMLQLQARYLVGAANLLGQSQVLYAQAKTLQGTDYEQQLCFATIAGEMSGPEEALRLLRELPDEPDADVDTARALTAIYQTRLANSANEGAQRALPAEAVTRAREKLGWFGDLAAAPPETSDAAARAAALAPAQRTAMVLFAVFILVLFGVFAGVIVLVLISVLTTSGTLRPRLQTGSPYGGIYAETFALWMAVYLGMSYAGSFVAAPGSRVFVSGLAMVFSLVVLLWPVVRGVPWPRVRHDAGLAPGGGRIADFLQGVVTYAAAIPLLLAGVMVTLALSAVAKRLGLPTEIRHPLAPLVVESGWWGRVQAFLVASIVAPIVEETMFRGFLYRHLRESTARVGRIGSVAASALLACFTFAVVHPQGWLGVPPLMALALAFCLAREFCGTLVPAMVAHALQNTLVTTLLILAAG